VAITKDFQICERVRSDLRFEVFDLFNQKTWANPNSDLSNTQFGVITNANGNRSAQLGLKIVF